jgi:pyridoxine 5'-phosphate synthase PdxJ
MNCLNYEIVSYHADYNSMFVKVSYYPQQNTIEIHVGDYGNVIYSIELSSNTRHLPEFKRFNNEIRARIATGIHICSELPNFNLPFELTGDDRPNPWWKQRGEVPVS